MPSEDLFQAQRLFEAHDAMQLELSTSSSTSMSASPPLCQQIRDQYRRVHPLYAALTDKDAWPGGDEIARGCAPSSLGMWRAHADVEVPPAELAGVLVQPGLWVPLLLPRASVNVHVHDAFRCDATIVVPSSVSRALDVHYVVSQTLYRTQRSLLVYIEDAEASGAKDAKFGQHLLAVRAGRPEEAKFAHVVVESGSCVEFTRYFGKVQEYAAYMFLGRMLPRLQRAAAQFYMCDSELMHWKAAFQRKTTVVRWVQDTFSAGGPVLE